MADYTRPVQIFTDGVAAIPARFNSSKPPALQVETKGNRLGVLGIVNQDGSDGFGYPTGVTGVGYNTSSGKQVFGIYAEAHTSTNGVATSEIDCFNDSTVTPSAAFPPDRSPSNATPLPIALTLGAGGQSPCYAALQVVREGSSVPSQPFRYGIYMNPDAILNYALFMDADGTNSPEISAIIRNKGGSGTGDNCNLQLQTMGSPQPNGSVIRVYDAGGNIKFRLTQDGSLITPNWQVDSGGTEHTNAPSSFSVGGAGVAAVPPSRPAEWMDVYHNGNLRSIPLYIHA